jgi:peptide deformylase
MDIITDRSILEQVSRVTTIEECKELQIFEKLEIALKNSKTPGAGLAAIQIGIPIRASLMITDKHVYHMINPELVEKNIPTIWPNEGCLSEPGVVRNTDRFQSVIVKWLDYEDKIEHKASTDGFNAVVLQHECDHMDGVLNYKREHKYLPKVGRNYPCPCGSGKKYKHCCLK